MCCVWEWKGGERLESWWFEAKRLIHSLYNEHSTANTHPPGQRCMPPPANIQFDVILNSRRIDIQLHSDSHDKVGAGKKRS